MVLYDNVHILGAFAKPSAAVNYSRTFSAAPADLQGKHVLPQNCSGYSNDEAVHE